MRPKHLICYRSAPTHSRCIVERLLFERQVEASGLARFLGSFTGVTPPVSSMLLLLLLFALLGQIFFQQHGPVLVMVSSLFV
jgi:hypothetical protein